MSKLLITGCSHGGWYKDLIGETVPNNGLEYGEYRSVDNSGYINFVLEKDCEVVEDE